MHLTQTDQKEQLTMYKCVNIYMPKRNEPNSQDKTTKNKEATTQPKSVVYIQSISSKRVLI